MTDKELAFISDMIITDIGEDMKISKNKGSHVAIKRNNNIYLVPERWQYELEEE